MEISKELLSEVLKEKVESFSVHGYILEYSAPLTGFNKAICIHELAHKCKEWAYSKGYSIYTGLLNGRWEVVSKISELFSDERIEFKHEFQADSEPESIFKACQLILDNDN
jgi:hypothetical protein